MDTKYIRLEIDQHNIATVLIDNPDKSLNVMNQAFAEEFHTILQHLELQKDLKGIIIMSAKKSFLVGSDLDMIFHETDPQKGFVEGERFKKYLRKLEKIEIPVVAAINGTALGGGFELALACHYRIAIDNPVTRIGFPEVSLGLMPGLGGVIRLVFLLGIEAAQPILMSGKPMLASKAKKIGLIDELVNNHEDLLSQARDWILNHPEAAQPWDQPKFRIPGGNPRDPRSWMRLAPAPAILQKDTFGNYAAPKAILTTMIEGTSVDFDTAQRIESRYAAHIASSQEAKNMLTAFWYQKNEIDKGRSRPNGFQQSSFTKVGILGAGMMGHGIAYEAAKAGIDVVLKDVSKEEANRGKSQIEGILDTLFKLGKISKTRKTTILDKIFTTGTADDLKNCDLVIEAVFENRELKTKVTREAEEQLTDTAVFASNTSTLPITGLAEQSMRPNNFVGLHFFSPVHRMKLVEIIRAEKTSDDTLAKAFDFVQKISKVPVVVNDSRGFYTSRVFGTYISEGVAMLAEGQHPHAIELAGRRAGMPVGPLSVSDEINMGLMSQIREQTIKDLQTEGKEFPYHPSHDVLDKMVKLKRLGKAQGKGFYEYPEDSKKYLWPGLKELFPLNDKQLPHEDMMERLMFIQALETVRCYEEGIFNSVADANLGSIFGWGFAPFKGGTLQCINDYGLKDFILRSNTFTEKYGDRFKPPQLLEKMSKNNETFV